jgi:hypothetical protein
MFKDSEEEDGRGWGMTVGWTNKRDGKGVQEKGGELKYGLSH